MTELQAHKEAMDLWCWLWKNPTKHKSDYPLYSEKIIFLGGDCPLCHFHRFDCSECCLKSCINTGDDYLLWASSLPEKSPKYSKNIYKTIRNKYISLKIKELLKK